MAARKKITLADKQKDSIRATQIMNRLEKCAMGEVEMTTAQLKASDIVLKKILPDLAKTELSGDPEAPLGLSFTVNHVKSKDV